MPVKKHTAATKQKIAATRKRQEDEKKIKLALFAHEAELVEKEKPKSTDELRSLIFSLRQDVYRSNFTSLTADRVSAVLDSTKNGTLRDWADFCDSIVERDPQLAMLLTLRKMAVAGKPIAIEPRSESAADRFVASFVQKKIDAIPRLRNLVSHLLHAIFTGVAIAEIDWEYDPLTGTYGVQCIRPLHARKFAFDESLCLTVNDTASEINGERLGDYRGKFIVHTPQVLSPYPVLDGLLRPAAFYSFFKRKGLSYWLGGAERFAFPSILATVPQNTDPTVLQNIRADLERLTSDAISVVKAGVNVQPIVNGTAGGDVVWERLESYIDDQLAKLIVGGTLSTDIGGAGSFALGKVHDARFNSLSVADAETLSETLQECLVKPIIEMNAHLLPTVECPLVFFDGVEQYPEIKQHHIMAGVATKNDLRRELGLPRLPRELGGEDIASLGDVAAASSVPAQGSPPATEPVPKPTEEQSGATGADGAVSEEPTENLQQQALNGAQVTALQGIIAAVTQKQLPAASAIEMIVNAFPTIDRATAERMVNPAAAFVQAPQPE